MGDIAIKVEGISKKYRIGGKQVAYTTLGETLSGMASAPLRRIRSVIRNQTPMAADETFWALRDVSFDVKHGEVIGIIGRNGAGKSTLLKILSRITDPTEGRAELYGSVGSLLEVGTGFHPELTGRENMYLSGAIIGMSKRDIDHKFDEIVTFAGVEQFIDTPVKRYSSGMYVRLAFAVAAHLEPEILLIDEVLAVGDVAFQKKCLGKMSDIAHGGRTVLFVSHNMSAVASLCNRGVLLKDGQVNCIGPVDDVVRAYLSEVQNEPMVDLAENKDREGDGTLRVTGLWLENNEGQQVSTVQAGDDVTFVLQYECKPGAEFPNDVYCAITLVDPLGQRMCTLSTHFAGVRLEPKPSGGRWKCTVHKLPLMPDQYALDLWCGSFRNPFDHVPRAGVFDVIAGDFFGSGQFPISKPKHGVFVVQQAWEQA
ncbi:MAG: ABC transporter ATP-binding protein [Anaerolineae bacterium]|nr:ABC transporter ATP-binding protein [Anaerolineae bacterium]